MERKSQIFILKVSFALQDLDITFMSQKKGDLGKMRFVEKSQHKSLGTPEVFFCL